jgi:hypothetical protein
MQNFTSVPLIFKLNLLGKKSFLPTYYVFNVVMSLKLET